MNRRAHTFVLFICGLLLAILSFSVDAATTPEERLKMADDYLRTKNYIKAKGIYRDIFLATPKGRLGERALLGIGKSDYHLKNYYEARQILKRILSESPVLEYRNEAHLLLGYISLHFQRFREADQHFSAVGESLREKANIGKAEVALKTGDILRSETLLLTVSKRIRETDPRTLYIRAVLYSKKGMHVEAVRTINKILDSALKEHNIRGEKAHILFNAKKLKEAEKLCRSIIDSPTSSIEKIDAKRVLLQIYEVEGKVDEALKLAIELLPYEPSDDFKMRIASLYDKKGDLNNAMKYLSYIGNKRLRSAEIEKRIRSAISLKDPNATEYVQRFSSYLDADAPFIVEASRYLVANNKKIEGKQLLMRALKSAARGEASLYLAELLIQEGRYIEAEKMLVPLTMDAPYSYNAFYMLADVMERQGRYAAAIEYLLRIVRIAPDYKVVAKLGDLYYKTEDRQSALKYYIIASNRGDGLSSVKAGDCLYISGDYAKAKTYYKRALDYNVKDPKILQWAQYQYGKLTKNEDYLKKAIAGGGEIAEVIAVISGGK